MSVAQNNYCSENYCTYIKVNDRLEISIFQFVSVIAVYNVCFCCCRSSLTKFYRKLPVKFLVPINNQMYRTIKTKIRNQYLFLSHGNNLIFLSFIFFRKICILLNMFSFFLCYSIDFLGIFFKILNNQKLKK